jgi:hypothetical protein
VVFRLDGIGGLEDVEIRSLDARCRRSRLAAMKSPRSQKFRNAKVAEVVESPSFQSLRLLSMESDVEILWQSPASLARTE